MCHPIAQRTCLQLLIFISPPNETHAVRAMERQCRSLAEELKDVESQRRMAINQTNKMQLLSRSQTAILRANFTTKIKQRDVIINDLFDVLRNLEEKPLPNNNNNNNSKDPALESLTERWRKICRNNAGLGENEPDGLANEMEELRAEVRTIDAWHDVCGNYVMLIPLLPLFL